MDAGGDGGLSESDSHLHLSVAVGCPVVVLLVALWCSLVIDLLVALWCVLWCRYLPI